MTLEEYIKANYKEEQALPYEKWLIAQADFDGNGKITKYVQRLNNKGKWVNGTRLSGEKSAYDKLQKDPSTYSKWEAYRETIIATNNQKLRELKAIWETSNAFQSGSAESADLFKADNGITTRYESDVKNYQTNNYIKYALIAVSIIAGVVLLSNVLKTKRK